MLTIASAMKVPISGLTGVISMDASVLFMASVCGHIHAFHMPYLRMLRDRGYNVLAAGRYDGAEDAIITEGFSCVDVPFSRNPLDLQNTRAFRAVCALLGGVPSLRLVHVHTPVAAFVLRMGSRYSGFAGKVLYTAHGFHFYGGANALNWTTFYPLEALAARYTDGIITINREDYERALRFRLKPNGRVYYVPGVGVDTILYSYQGDAPRTQVRGELGIGDDDIVIICVAELNDNKNQIQLLRAAALIKEKIPAIRLLLAGEGSSRNQLESYARDHGLAHNVLFLGHRDDVPRLLTACDIASLVSRREGLPRFVMEAAAAGLPLVCTDIRGNRDIVTDGLNGYLVPVGDYRATAENIIALAKDEQLRWDMGKASVDAVKPFSLDKVLPVMEGIYHDQLKNDR